MNNNWVIVTGADRGIGESLAALLADMDYGVIMACRNVEKASLVFEHIRYITSNRDIRLMPLDLSSLESVASFVRSVDEKGYNVRALVNNAATLCKHCQRTADGFERTVGVNYIGTYLLTRLLMPVLQRSQGLSKVMNTVSMAVKFGRVDKDFFRVPEKKYRELRSYASSKLALLMFTQSLTEKLGKNASVVANAFNPGLVNTKMLTMHNWLDPLFDILVRPLLKTADRAAQQQCEALFPKKEKGGGRVYAGRRQFLIRDFAAAHKHKEWLYRHTEEILRGKGYELPPLDKPDK